MSKSKQDMQSVKLAPRVDLCDNNQYSFLAEMERLILSGYRIALNERFDLMPCCYIATMVLPNQDTASV